MYVLHCLPFTRLTHNTPKAHTRHLRTLSSGKNIFDTETYRIRVLKKIKANALGKSESWEREMAKSSEESEKKSL